MKNVTFILLVVLLTGTASDAFAQKDSSKVFRIEIEPAQFLLKGYSFILGSDLTKNDDISASIYLMGLDIPRSFEENQFLNLTDSSDAIQVVEVAGILRYKFNLSKKWKSDPYVGLIIGWEMFRFEPIGGQDLYLSTWFVTPHIGYELFVLKKTLYLNPQIRYVLYFGEKKSTDKRAETLSTGMFLPSIAIGVKL